MLCDYERCKNVFVSQKLEHCGNDIGSDWIRFGIGLHWLHAIEIRESGILCSTTGRWYRGVFETTIEMGVNCLRKRGNRKNKTLCALLIRN